MLILYQPDIPSFHQPVLERAGRTIHRFFHLFSAGNLHRIQPQRLAPLCTPKEIWLYLLRFLKDKQKLQHQEIPSSRLKHLWNLLVFLKDLKKPWCQKEEA